MTHRLARRFRFGPLAPVPRISPADEALALRRLAAEGAWSSAAAVLTSGVILTAFALSIGASDAMIGILASAPFLCQLLQGPAILLIERTRRRKAIAVLSSIVGRVMLLAMGAAAFLPHPWSIVALGVGQFVLCSAGAIGTCAWNAWLRDLAPDDRRGEVMARRTINAGIVSLIVGLVAAFALDRAGAGGMVQATVFAGLYGVGLITGLVSAAIVAMIPEPTMPEQPSEPLGLWRLLRAPFADRNFRKLTGFLSSWQFAINLATPFFTVFLMRQQGFSMTFVMGLNVASQLANLAALRMWGTLSDRFANKSVLAAAAPTYILCILGMIGASQIDGRLLAGVYLVVLHVVMGAAVAGVTLATTNIALKLSPRGESTAYVATSAFASALAAGIAPILGGLLAQTFAARRLEVQLRWTSPDGLSVVQALRLSNWDFHFLIAAIVGLFALHRLSLVREKGEIDPRMMIHAVMTETRRNVRNLGTVAGLRALTIVPGTMLREARTRARFDRLQRRRDGASKNHDEPLPG